MIMKELALKYGCNPNQKPPESSWKGTGASIHHSTERQTGYINFMDALNGWQLVKS